MGLDKRLSRAVLLGRVRGMLGIWIMAHIEFDLASCAFTSRGIGLATSGSLERLQKSSRQEHRWA